jgi:hypothetical protein
MHLEPQVEDATMEPGRIHTAAPSPSEGEQPADQSLTCGRFPVLAICEKAHRDRTGRPLCLGSPDFPAEQIQHHLDVEGCPICRRWYDNAFAEYGRLVPVVRRARLIKMRASDAGEACHELPVVENSTGFNSVPLVLKWHADKEASPSHPSWWVQLKAHADVGKQGQLKKYHRQMLHVTVEPAEGGPPVSVETLLGFDADNNLVTAEKLLPIDPRQDLKVTLRLRSRTSPRKGSSQAR